MYRSRIAGTRVFGEYPDKGALFDCGILNGGFEAFFDARHLVREHLVALGSQVYAVPVDVSARCILIDGGGVHQVLRVIVEPPTLACMPVDELPTIDRHTEKLFSALASRPFDG